MTQRNNNKASVNIPAISTPVTGQQNTNNNNASVNLDNPLAGMLPLATRGLLVIWSTT
jgi:hypothetical protein